MRNILTKPTIWNLCLVQSMAVKLIKLDNLKIKKLKLKNKELSDYFFFDFYNQQHYVL